MRNKIALGEPFAIDLTIEQSKGYAPSHVWEMLTSNLMDIEQKRLERMEQGRSEYSILSLNSPGIQGIPDIKEGIDVGRRPNDVLARLKFLHQGQVCMSAGRHLVQQSIADAYVESLVRRPDALSVGDPFKGDFHLDPIVNERQAANVDRIVTESAGKGAKILAGGSRDGLFYKSTVMVDFAPGMQMVEEDIFGPVAAVTVAKDDDEAVALANQNRYGLVAAVASSDLRRASGLRTDCVPASSTSMTRLSCTRCSGRWAAWVCRATGITTARWPMPTTSRNGSGCGPRKPSRLPILKKGWHRTPSPHTGRASASPGS
ncbi:aldehyde dehydrogenase family protein [Paraburkholderia sp. GAS348]|uniref:aldehyde dehydrogenase family protein n=1 Tax=Paraburkholderia sp. GAS348 TaxID=3035132 RepID=UPI003D1C8962